MNKTFVIGDIHGAYRALRQCLDRSGFGYTSDQLICLGDVCDGWPETRECIDELTKIRNLTYILGNHDYWTLLWMKTGEINNGWLTQGGDATVKSYQAGVPVEHLEFLEDAAPYYLLDNRLFVHAGIDPFLPLEKQGLDTFLWDRNLALDTLDLYEKKATRKLTHYDEVYLGHTPTSFGTPVNAGDVWLMDTGAGWAGVLSIMEINTKEIFASDTVPSLYPGQAGRGSK